MASFTARHCCSRCRIGRVKVPATRAYLVKRQGLVFLDDRAQGVVFPPRQN
jgi:hypothetical protein